MTEQNAALAFDRALDGERGISLNGSESLVLTAHAMQTLFDRQQEIPTEEFVMQLERSLFGLPVVPSLAVGPVPAEGPPAHTVIPTEVEGPPAEAVSHPQPAPRPTPIHPNRTHPFARWTAIAAALILLFGGAGAIALGPFDLHSTPEPSAIPAISFGTVEASPEPVDSTWTVAPPKSTTGSDRPGVISNGIMFRTFTSGGGRPIQAVDLRTGTVLWEDTPIVTQEMLAVVGDMLLVAGSDGIHWQLVALDGRTGEQGWSIELTQRPVGLRVADDRVFVLGNMNLLESYELEDQELLWSADLSQYDHSPNEYGGVNKFGDLAGDRLAMTDGTIGAIVSNGRLVAVDAADGKVKWADDRMTDGWTRVKVVDGKFVVTAFGGKPLMYDPEATPLPITPIDPAADPCTRVIEPRSGSKPEAAADIGETIDSFDPQTGESPWGLILPEQYFVWPVDESRLIAQVEQVQSAGVADNGDLFPCLIDGATGAVSETSGDEFLTFVIPSSDESGTYWGVGALPDGIPFWVSEVDSATANTLPIIDLGKDFSGLRWVQKADGMILVTAQDGTLIGFPDRRARQVSASTATPAVQSATPETAEVAWKVDGPDIPGGWLGNQAIDDEHLYLSYETGTTEPGTILAVDLETGDTAWSIAAPVLVRVMETSGNLLLVAGLDKSTGGAYRMAAYDIGTGEEVWNVPLRGTAVALSVVGERVLVLCQNNTLQAYALDSGEWISSTDIGGRSKPSYTVVYMGNRLAIIDQTLVAVLADGSVAGVGLETGVAKWWALRGTPGQTMVVGMDGNLIVLARPDADLSADGEGGSATPAAMASPIAAGSPAPVSCQGTVHLALPQATIDGDGLEQGETMIMRLSLDDGTTLWNARSDQYYYPDFVSSAGLLSVATAGQAWPIDRSGIAMCATDPSTGQVSTVEQLADVAQQTTRFTFTSTENQQMYETILGIDGAGGTITLPAEFDPSVRGPVVDSFGLLCQDGAFYFASNDGQIMKVVLPTDS